MKKAVAYYRVSTGKQQRSGLGLEAQAEAVSAFVEREQYELIASYTETESGKHDDRSELTAALARCKRERATLLIAKLDRLSRRLSFVAKLMDSNADFRVVEIPNAERFELHIRAVFGEHEREQISKRTKAALAAAKQRGTILGRHGRDVLSKQNAATADQFAQAIKPQIDQLRIEGFTTYRSLCAEMNRRKIPTFRQGRSWHKSSLYNVLKRIEGTNGCTI